MQCRLVDCYRRFETTYWSPSSRVKQSLTLEDITDTLFRNTGNKIPSLLCKVPEEGKSQLSSGLIWTMLTDTYMIFPLHIHLFSALCAVGSLKWISMWPSECNESRFWKLVNFHPLHSFIIHSVVWLIYSLYQSEFSIQCNSASFPCNFQYPLFSLRPSSSWLCLLPHPPIISFLPSIFLLITCFGKQFLCRMWPIQLASLFFNL
jgi:hypothetical protein